MIYKLKEMYKTRYFYKSYLQDLEYLFKSCKALAKDPTVPVNRDASDLHRQLYDDIIRGESYTFDVADCVIGPECARCILVAQQQGFMFIDSEDKANDNLLRVNYQRIQFAPKETVPLPEFTTTTDLKSYLPLLKSDVVYSIPPANIDLYVPLAILIMMLKPKSINIDSGANINLILRYVAKHISIADSFKNDTFYWCSNDGVTILEFDSAGKADVPGYGYIDKMETATHGVLVPIIFGTVPTFMSPEFSSLKDACIEQINAFVKSSPRKLCEIF